MKYWWESLWEAAGYCHSYSLGQLHCFIYFYCYQEKVNIKWLNIQLRYGKRIAKWTWGKQKWEHKEEKAVIHYEREKNEFNFKCVAFGPH